MEGRRKKREPRDRAGPRKKPSAPTVGCLPPGRAKLERKKKGGGITRCTKKASCSRSFWKEKKELVKVIWGRGGGGGGENRRPPAKRPWNRPGKKKNGNLHLRRQSERIGKRERGSRVLVSTGKREKNPWR